MTTVLSQAAIPVAALDIVRERVARVARRADKRGFPVPALVQGERSIRRIRDTSMDEAYEGLIAKPDPVYYEVEYIDVSIEASGPLQINGWLFIASVDAVEVDGKTESLYRRVPGTEDIPLPKWAKAPDDCDHCGLKRQRNETFLLFDVQDMRTSAESTLPYKQVGRQCVRDFIGYDPEGMIAAIEAYDSLVFDEDEIRGWGASAERSFQVDDILGAAAQALLVQGFYVSKSKARESEELAAFDDSARRNILTSTGDVVRMLLTPPRTKADREDRRKYEEVEQAKVDELRESTKTALIDLARKPETSEWEDNILMLSKAERIKWQHVGILASAILLGSRMIERAAKAKVKALEAPSVHIGEIGKRINFEAVVELIRFFDNDYGGTFLVKLRHADGDMTWWSSADVLKEERSADNDWQGKQYETGDRVKVRATIKAHTIDRFTQQPVTMLSRAKLELIKDAPPVPVAEVVARQPDELPF